ncbi:MAG: NERD domain-containing protein [Thaumarchaeota archaeon]|nr:NERD domain-containing protein [Nitrososphaerota archaeon]
MAIIYGMADSEKNLLKKLPGEVRNYEDMDRVKRDFENKIKQVDDGFFAGLKKWNYKRQVKKFDRARENPLHAGTRGENKVIEELLKLDEHYHILCGVRIELPYYVWYNGQKNLKSAQMDLVVVCPKGVFMIEVKNWSNDYAKNYDGLNPYEQTDRAGRVLWIALQDIIKNIRVTNVLLSIQGNISYNERYRAVFVSSLNRINQFLEKRQDALSPREVKIIVDELKYYVTR